MSDDLQHVGADTGLDSTRDEFEIDIVGTKVTVYYANGEDPDEYYTTAKVSDIQEEFDCTMADADFYPKFIAIDTLPDARVYIALDAIITVEIERAVLVKGDLVAPARRPAKKRPAAVKKPAVKKATPTRRTEE